MNDDIHMNRLADEARDIHLSTDMHQRVRAELVAYARAHPALQPSPYLRFVRAPAFVGALLVLLMTGGATTSAAFGSLPGDALYALKVNVLEPARGLFAIQDVAKVKWNVALAEARLHEAERLAATSDFTEQIQGDVANRFLEAVITARALLERIKDPEAAVHLAADLDLSLAAHADILSTIANSTGSAPVRRFAGDVAQAAGAVSQTVSRVAPTAAAGGEEHEAAVSSHALQAAQGSTDKAKTLLMRARRALDVSAASEAEVTLRAADETLSEGQKKLEAKEYAGASADSLRARLLAEEIILLISGTSVSLPPAEITPPNPEERLGL